VQTWDFHLRASGQETRKYMFKTYDETMLSVMVGGFFSTLYILANLRRVSSSLLSSTTHVNLRTAGRWYLDPSICMTDHPTTP
jgi:hypothetical protein